MLETILKRASGAVFGAGSLVRGTKVLHPHGAVYDAVLTLNGAPDAPGFLKHAGAHPAVVRLSRGAGFPKPLPDFIGLAIRLTDLHGPGRHQDFLLLTSGEGAWLHHVFRPTKDVASGPYSSILPYGERDGDGSFIVAARPKDDRHFVLGVTPVGGRRMRPVGVLELGGRRPDPENAIRFNPWNTGGGISPTGLFNRLRDAAYPSSQAGWARSSDGASDLAVDGDVV